MRLGMLAAFVAAVLASAAPADAAIVNTRDASAVASAIVRDASTLRGASWVAITPEDGEVGDADSPAATIDGALAGFPANGSTAGLLTSGDPQIADDENTGSGDGRDNGGAANLVDAAGVNRGATAYDVTILKLDLTAPANTNCLSFLSRFASEEYPEFVNSRFNDAFIAELNGTSWTTTGDDGATISAPKNFAFDPAGNVISINATGGESVAPEDAAGTTYDAATQILQASVPVTPGDHTLYLSVFDQGDNIYDAAVFLDDLGFSQQPAGGCESGAAVNEFVPPVSTTSTQIPPFTKSGVIEFVVTDGPRGSGPRAVHYKLNGGEEQVLRTTGVPGKASITLPDGRYTIEYWGEDRRGNQEAEHHVASVVVDNVAPVLTLTNLQKVTVFSEGAAAFLQVGASDPLAGLKVNPANARLALDTSTPGPKVVTFTATDNADNTSTATFAYTVTKVTPASVITLPKAKKCVSRRKFSIRVRRKPDMVITQTSVKVGTKKARVFKGRKATAPINLRGITGKRTVKITVTVTTSTGKTFRITRKYKTCRAKRR